MTTHVLDTTARPPACSCGHARYAGSLTFVRDHHAAHVADEAALAATRQEDPTPVTDQPLTADHVVAVIVSARDLVNSVSPSALAKARRRGPYGGRTLVDPNVLVELADALDAGGL